MTAPQPETVVYARDLALDIFRPSTENRHCAVLLLHGGGWRGGAKEFVHEQAVALAAQGFTAIAVQYRLLGVAPWPAQLDDAVAACAWVRDNADTLDIDPARLVVQGHSAGAQMALLTGALDPDVRPAAIVAYYPAIGFHPSAMPELTGDPDAPRLPPLPLDLDEIGRVPSWMLFPTGATEAELSAASPIDLLHKDFPPTIVFHATADVLFDVRSSVALHQRLTALGVSAELHVYADRNHGFDRAPSMARATVAATTSFLERMVTHREDSAAETLQHGFPPVPQP
ncbi:alpha/beta hydrolase [Kutzneria sp. NPDC051319]|uniref:alpha/beta hydrolase n=1 Tax=Kutzneria sp. NPDC051319 TaxID=3155047 RepID=UPI00342EFA0A